MLSQFIDDISASLEQKEFPGAGHFAWDQCCQFVSVSNEKITIKVSYLYSGYMLQSSDVKPQIIIGRSGLHVY